MPDPEQHPSGATAPRTKPLSVINTILGECLCIPFPLAGAGRGGFKQDTQFVELHGVEFIGLGAVMDELSPSQRVAETVQYLLERTERLISLGYLVETDKPSLKEGLMKQGHPASSYKSRRITETIPLETWRKNYPNDRSTSRHLQQTIDFIASKQFDKAIAQLKKQYEVQKNNPQRDNNRFLVGVTAHNIGVLHVMAGKEEMALQLFRQAVTLKRSAFGEQHPQVAVSLDEIGIQLFAKERFEDAVHAFNESKKIRIEAFGDRHLKVAMASNNIACCNFQLGDQNRALATFQEAQQILQHASAARVDLDVLQVAIVLGNVGYMQIRLKNYDEARAIFEEALLIQQSVLGDGNNRALIDTRSNMDFTNAFHS